MNNMNDAPMDGRRIWLIKESGKKRIGRWAKKDPSFTHEFGWHEYKEAWIDDGDKFIDIPADPVVGWDCL